MILINAYKASLWNGIWINLEVIIIATTRIIIAVATPSRYYPTFVIGNIIIVVVSIIIVALIISILIIVYAVFAILTNLICQLVCLGVHIVNHTLQLVIII